MKRDTHKQQVILRMHTKWKPVIILQLKSNVVVIFFRKSANQNYEKSVAQINTFFRNFISVAWDQID